MTISSTSTATTSLADPRPTMRLADADVLDVAGGLDPDERIVYESMHAYFQSEIRPKAIDYWKRGEFPFELVDGLAEQDLVGISTGSKSHLFVGLVQMALARADLSVSAFFGVHHELFVSAVRTLGSEEQQARLLPDLLALRKVGAFALTEPLHGSDISRTMECTARREGDAWVLTGEKRWIGNATFSDYVLVWARDADDGQIKGFIVERGMPGFTSTRIDGKIAARAVQNADLVLDDVRVPEANRLARSQSFRDTNDLLCNSRAWVAWQAVGLQFAAFDVARAYASERLQFGRPIAASQIVQEQLARMLGNASMSLATMVQIARVQDEGRLTMTQAAMVKAMCTLRMRETVALGRAMLGGNGILADYEMAKIFAGQLRGHLAHRRPVDHGRLRLLIRPGWRRCRITTARPKRRFPPWPGRPA